VGKFWSETVIEACISTLSLAGVPEGIKTAVMPAPADFFVLSFGQFISLVFWERKVADVLFELFFKTIGGKDSKQVIHRAGV
jgi:hypothetical protein